MVLKDTNICVDFEGKCTGVKSDVNDNNIKNLHSINIARWIFFLSVHIVINLYLFFNDSGFSYRVYFV